MLTHIRRLPTACWMGGFCNLWTRMSGRGMERFGEDTEC